MRERLERLEELLQQSLELSQQFNLEESIQVQQEASEELSNILLELEDLYGL